jgi:thiamine-monophosphate kinase
MTEFELIARLTRGLPAADSVVVGPGDDCAALDLGVQGQWALFKTDAVVEGVHFCPDAPPEKIGRKALARCLSDIAAMAGTPAHAVVTLALPPKFDPAHVVRVYDGLRVLAAEHRVAIVGGETTASAGGLMLSVAMLGFVPRDRCIRRAGAKAGDALFVTGTLGGSIAGRHFDFEPRLVEARWLAGHFPVHAMIDVSDGLAGDLGHILAASGVGAELRAASIPVSREAKARSRASTLAKPPLAAALTDGEDFELLFALPGGHAVALADAWKAQFPQLRLTCIGRVTAESGLRLRDERGVRPIAARGFEHFAVAAGNGSA